MLLTPLTHPPLIGALAAAGHGSRVLIADGNYPVSTAVNADASTVHLNLQPGTVDAVTVLRALTAAVPIEAAAVMAPDAGEPAIFADFAALLPALPLRRLARHEFYAAARSADTAVVIATGEVQHFGNLLLTIGVVPVAQRVIP